ncbi:MAG: hypothetical protein WC788_01800 [Candidatus Paceibacterota bacterium]|jgi:hypothetical protein
MIKIEEKTDKGYFAALRELLELYKKGAKAGNYYKILPQDIVAEGISLEGRETLSSEEEGLRELARVIYYAATGIWEYNDRSIKLDGYPKIDSMMWPVLEIIFSKTKIQGVDDIEAKIKEIEKGAKEDEIAPVETEKVIDGETGKEEKIVEPVLENKTRKVPNNALTYFLTNEGCRINAIKGKDHPRRSNAEEDLSVLAPSGGKIFKLVSIHGIGIIIFRSNGTNVEYYVGGDEYEISEEINEKEIRLHKLQTWDAKEFLHDLELFLWGQRGFKGDLYWTYNAKKALVYIEFKDTKGLTEAGFIDKKERVKVSLLNIVSWGLFSDTGKSVSELEEKLWGKRILSVYDGSNNGWFLKVC